MQAKDHTDILTSKIESTQETKFDLSYKSEFQLQSAREWKNTYFWSSGVKAKSAALHTELVWGGNGWRQSAALWEQVKVRSIHAGRMPTFPQISHGPADESQEADGTRLFSCSLLPQTSIDGGKEGATGRKGERERERREELYFLRRKKIEGRRKIFPLPAWWRVNPPVWDPCLPEETSIYWGLNLGKSARTAVYCGTDFDKVSNTTQSNRRRWGRMVRFYLL